MIDRIDTMQRKTDIHSRADLAVMQERRKDAVDVAADFLHGEDDATGVLEKMRQAVTLEEEYDLAWKWLDGRADADCDQDGFIPNPEMVTMTEMWQIMAGGLRNLV